MLLVKYLVVILHIATAAAWFGLALRLAGQARTVAAAAGEARAALAADIGKTVGQVGLFLILTFVFGSINIVIVEMWPQTGVNYNIAKWPYHTSITLLLVAIGAHYAITRPAWKKVASGDASAAKRVAMGVGIGHLIWLVTLILMFWPLMAPAFR